MNALARRERSPIELSLAPMQLRTEPLPSPSPQHSRAPARRKKILSMARFDPLTGLFNRTTSRNGSERRRSGDARRKSFALLHLDLDHFEDVDDALGHPKGDALLRAVGERLRSNIRDRDMVARLGADEFGMMKVDLNGPKDASVSRASCLTF